MARLKMIIATVTLPFPCKRGEAIVASVQRLLSSGFL
jgi:hypothetical protein